MLLKKLFNTIEYQIRLHANFSKKEARGTLVLILLMLFSMILPQWYRFISMTEEPLSFQEEKSLDSIFALIANDHKNEISFYKKNNPPHHYAKTKSNYKPSEKIYLDLNATDSISLLALKGIGPVLAGRIIRFRDQLGGFISKEQLKKVYGIKPEVYESISSHVYVVPDFIPQKINLNTADYPALCQHPFISKKQAYEIIQFRKKNKKIVTLDFLQNDTLIASLQPYLEF